MDYDWQYDYKEAGVIGTLRASGYTGNELIRHYMTLPVLVTLAGALTGIPYMPVPRRLCGNVLWKPPSDLCDGMECGSLSYDDSDTDRNHGTGELWNPSSQNAAFPTEISEKRSFRKKQKRAVSLSPRMKIFTRFRFRVIFQNISNYLVLFVDSFANLLLMFGLLLPSALDHYQLEIQNNMLAKYQYMLSMPVSILEAEINWTVWWICCFFSHDTDG